MEHILSADVPTEDVPSQQAEAIRAKIAEASGHLVEQLKVMINPDGVVVIEARASNIYAKQLIDYIAAKNSGGMPVTNNSVIVS